MLGLGLVCITGGLCAKYVGSSLAVTCKDLDACPAIGALPHKPPDTALYGHFRGALSSDQQNKVQDKDSGIEFDVVGVRKVVVELFEDTTKTTDLDTGESTKVAWRGETVLSDTGKQHFGTFTLKASVPAAVNANMKKLNLKDNGDRQVECVLSAGCQREVPFSKAFSNYQPVAKGVNVTVHTNNYAKNTKKKPRFRKTQKPRLEITTNREVSGVRTDVFAAKVGTEVTVIGDFIPNPEKTAWVAVPSTGKLGDVTLRTFDQYKADKAFSSTAFSNVGTGLIVLGSVFGLAHMRGGGR